MHAASRPGCRARSPRMGKVAPRRGAPTITAAPAATARPPSTISCSRQYRSTWPTELVGLCHGEARQPRRELARQQVFGGGHGLRQQRHQHDDGHAARHGEGRVEGVAGLEQAAAHELGYDHDGEEGQSVEPVGRDGPEQGRPRRAPQRRGRRGVDAQQPPRGRHPAHRRHHRHQADLPHDEDGGVGVGTRSGSRTTAGRPRRLRRSPRWKGRRVARRRPPGRAARRRWRWRRRGPAGPSRECRRAARRCAPSTAPGPPAPCTTRPSSRVHRVIRTTMPWSPSPM